MLISGPIHTQPLDVDLCVRLLFGNLHSSFDTVGHSIIAVTMVTGHYGHIFVRFSAGAGLDASVACVQSFVDISCCNCWCSFSASHWIYVVLLSRTRNFDCNCGESGRRCRQQQNTLSKMASLYITFCGCKCNRFVYMIYLLGEIKLIC